MHMSSVCVCVLHNDCVCMHTECTCGKLCSLLKTFPFTRLYNIGICTHTCRHLQTHTPHAIKHTTRTDYRFCKKGSSAHYSVNTKNNASMTCATLVTDLHSSRMKWIPKSKPQKNSRVRNIMAYLPKSRQSVTLNLQTGSFSLLCQLSLHSIL